MPSWLGFQNHVWGRLGQVGVINNPERGVWQDRNEAPIFFELVQTFGTDFPDEAAVFSRVNSIRGVKTDLSNNVYVLDNGANILVKFSSTGEVLWKIDQKGRGPGDLENPLGLAVNDEFVIVSNLFGSRLDVFTLGGVFVESVNLDEIDGFSVDIVGIVDMRYLILQKEIQGEIGTRIVVLDIENDFKVRSNFEALEKSDLDIPPNETLSNQTTIVDSLIVLSNNLDYGFKYYNLKGNFVKEIKREYPNYKRPGVYNKGGKGIMMTMGGIYNQYQLLEEYLINYIVWFDNIRDPDKLAKETYEGNFPEIHFKNSLDLFTMKGKLLYSIENNGMRPDIGKLMSTDKKGHLYTIIGKPYPQIRKYRVSIAEP